MNSLVKKAIAECLGTFVLVFFACGVASVTRGSLVATSLAFGLVIVAMAYSVGRISGCHINPAVSLGCLIAKRMSVKEFLVYVAAQFVGALLGGIVLFGLLKLAGFDFYSNNDMTKNVQWIGDASNYAMGGCFDAAHIIASFGVEIVLTCIFVYTILNVTAEESNSKVAGIVIGLTLTLVHLIGIGLTGTSVNPARSFGTSIASAMFGAGTESLKHLFIFILAPLAGGALAAVIYILLHNDKKNASADDSAIEEDKAE